VCRHRGGQTHEGSQEILDLLIERLPERLSPWQVAATFDKNYHTTRSLQCKIEAVGEIRRVNNHSVAIPRDISRNQRNHCNLLVASELRPADQMAHSEESFPSTTDYVDYTDVSVSSNVFQTHSIPLLLAESLQFPAAPEYLLS
jgi:hypothetical protein